MYMYTYKSYANGNECGLNMSMCTCVCCQDKGVESNQVVLTYICVCMYAKETKST